MNEYLLIFINDEGVLGVGRPTSYGCDAYYLCEGILFQVSLEPDDYEVYSEIDLDPAVLKLFEI